MENSPTLQELITSRLKEKNLSRSQVVQQIGYSNVSKGIRKFDTYLKTLSPPSDEFVSQLLSVLGVDGLTFHNACIASYKKMSTDHQCKGETFIQATPGSYYRHTDKAMVCSTSDSQSMYGSCSRRYQIPATQ